MSRNSTAPSAGHLRASTRRIPSAPRPKARLRADFESKPPPGGSDLEQLVAKAYAALAEPERFVLLAGELVEASERLGGLGDAADLHFGNAEAILGKMYPLEKTDYSALHAQAGSRPDCDLALDENGRIVSFDPQLFEHGNLSPGQFAPDWLFDPATGETDRRRLRNDLLRSDPNMERVFLRLYPGGEGEAGRWFSAGRATIEDRAVITLRAVRLRWDRTSGAMFQRAMDLTDTEVALTRHLVTGGKMREFAERRGRAIGTVRNQLKTLQRKLSIQSKEELLLLYAGFVHSLDPAQEEENASEEGGVRQIEEPDGGTIQWLEYGSPDGMPVLYMHPLEGAFLTPAMVRAAERACLRIIAPWRPYYGTTSSARPGADMPTIFARRLRALLDHLGIERCTALTTLAGAPYGMALTRELPERLTGIILASPFFPLREANDFHQLKLKQRANLLMARAAPSFARVHMRAMLASMKTGEFYRFVEHFYEDCPRELAVMRSPGMVEIFRRTACHIASCGVDGPVDTMLNWVAQWSDLLENVAVPVTTLVGEHDANMPCEIAKVHCARYGLHAPVIVPDAGSFLLHDQPSRVFEIVAQMARDGSITA